jgi:transcriptional regulator with XRE-family HTH domain
MAKLEAHRVGNRIKLARKMANFRTQTRLAQELEECTPQRINNYEQGKSVPNQKFIIAIAKATNVSPGWLLLGHGPIRPDERHRQAIRHQNYSRFFENCLRVSEPEPESETRPEHLDREKVAKLGYPADHLIQLYYHPHDEIEDTLARNIERLFKKRSGWMDDQHVEHDPILEAFPKDIRETLDLLSEMPRKQRAVAVATLKALAKSLRKL